jgi:hypothetical protein
LEKPGIVRGIIEAVLLSFMVPERRRRGGEVRNEIARGRTIELER